MNPLLKGLAQWGKQLVLRMIAADFILIERELDESIELQATSLEAEGKRDQAFRLRSLLNNDLKQLEGPRRGRPRKSEGGEG